MTHAAILPCSLTLLYPLMLPPAHESTILTLTLMLTLHLVITLQYPLTLLLAYDSMLTFSLVLPAGDDLVIRIGGGPQDSVVFAAGNYSWSSAVNKGGGCNASVFDYRSSAYSSTTRCFVGLLHSCRLQAGVWVVGDVRQLLCKTRRSAIHVRYWSL